MGSEVLDEPAGEDSEVVAEVEEDDSEGEALSLDSPQPAKTPKPKRAMEGTTRKRGEVSVIFIRDS